MVRLVYLRLRDELIRVFGPPWEALRTRRLAAFPLALICAATVASFGLIQHTGPGLWLVEHVAGVYQALPLGLLFLRLPLSMFAPAPDLPAWGATLQVLVVFGICEIGLGRARTLITAVSVNCLTTLAAWIMIEIGNHLALGTPQIDAYELDTGPSTVVVALSVYVALRYRAYVLLGLTAAAMATEALVLPNLAGREHLVALALGGLAFVIGERATAPWPRLRARTTERPAAPPTGGTPRPPASGAARPRQESRP